VGARCTGITLAALLLAFCSVVEVRAQPAAVPGLDDWLRTLHIDLRDQRNAYGGLFFDRGTSRFYTPRMDHEYHIDLRTARYETWRHDGWHPEANGFRTYAGSIDRSAFATTTDIRHFERIGRRHGVLLDARQQDDLSARRLFVDIGYRFFLTGRHRAGVNHSAGSFKPDLDLHLVYEADLRRTGKLDAGIYLLDYLNNFIYDVLGVDPVLDDTVRSYRRIPVLVHARWRTPDSLPFSMDVAAGVQPPAHARLSRQSDPDFVLHTRHHFRYAGAQVAGRIGPVTIGARHRYVDESRGFHSPAGSSAGSSFESRQRTHRTAMTFSTDRSVSRTHSLRMSATLEHLRYSDTQSGVDFAAGTIGRPFRLHERRNEGDLRIDFLPDRRGMRTGIRLLTDARRYSHGMDDFEATYLMFRQWSPNQRLAVHLGYQARPGVFIEGGASFDVDGDSFYSDGRGLTRFDGGFGRIQITW
jgi:hypothetical protein